MHFNSQLLQIFENYLYHKYKGLEPRFLTDEIFWTFLSSQSKREKSY